MTVTQQRSGAIPITIFCVFSHAVMVLTITQCRLCCQRSCLFSKLFAFYFFAQGGLRGVIWTDVFQTTIMLAGLIAVVIAVYMQCDHVLFTKQSSKYTAVCLALFVHAC